MGAPEVKAPDKQKRHYVTYAGMWFIREEDAYVVYVDCLYGHESRIEDAVPRQLRVRTFSHDIKNARKAMDLVQSLNSARFNIEYKENRLATLTDLWGECDEAKVVVGI